MIVTVTRSIVALAILVAATAPSTAADLAVAKKKAGECTPCHGLNGIAVQPDAPNLAGDSAYYLTAQLKAFRAGERQHEQMSIIAKGLSDEDIDDLAAWYSAIELKATLPKMD
ncbi:cytochrome c [Jiella endophytica]|uniref:Cytochrome c n=1 Tax=Jiella endophytica TaxID=2558362 RepID=A0A4Y8RU48_9HYPH|nr:cytochrome c [Jiella endophytica]TFF27327.1 cytochrome c [Jiella endophytica]